MVENHRRVVLITGGSQGIGFATVQKLAAQGFHIIIASRDQAKSAQAIERVRATTPGAGLESLPLDLASFDSVRQCAKAFLARGYPLHVLINNAGATMAGKQARLSDDGFELTFQTNHLGHFLLTNLLLDVLKNSAPARVVNVSSQTHIPGFGGGPPPDFDWDNLKGEKYYRTAVFYKNSKLANMWFTYELQRRLQGSGVTSNAMCPGFVPEAVAQRRANPLVRFMYKDVLSRMPFATSLDQAATSLAFTASDPSLDGVGGKFIVDCMEKRSSDESYDEQKARKLWDLNWQWCGL